jgi:hypothetical protein
MLAARVEQKNGTEKDDMIPLDNKRPIQGRDPDEMQLALGTDMGEHVE